MSRAIKEVVFHRCENMFHCLEINVKTWNVFPLDRVQKHIASAAAQIRCEIEAKAANEMLLRNYKSHIPAVTTS